MFLVKTLIFGVDVPGFPTLIISVMFFAGVQLISLGVIGEYLGRVYEEVKGRPLFPRRRRTWHWNAIAPRSDVREARGQRRE